MTGQAPVGRAPAGGRVGVIGCGNISRAYATKLGALPDLDLVACADLDPTRAQALAAEFEVPAILTPDELLTHPDVDVVLNLTVPTAHAAVTRAALRAGRHAYTEKPLALDVAEGRALLELAGRRRLRLGCAPDTFLGAGLQTCRALLDAGTIGTPARRQRVLPGLGARVAGIPTRASSTSGVRVPCSMWGCTT